MSAGVVENDADRSRRTAIVNEAAAAGELRPMEAVAALYSAGDVPVANAIVASLADAVFDDESPTPAGAVQIALARLTYWILKATTRTHVADGGAATAYRNRILERAEHPYSQALLASSRAETQSLVEGGDPMNGPYMMLARGIRKNATTWDRLFFHSVQGRDVQMRFFWETRATYHFAKEHLVRNGHVRLKALAGGTGLSMILVYDRLVREAGGSGAVTCRITDRDSANTGKSNRLLSKLATVRGWMAGGGVEPGLSAVTEDIFEGPSDPATYDVVTAVGILDYLQGFTCDTTERRLVLDEVTDVFTAPHLAERIACLTSPGASVIVNSHCPHPATRLLELFGKRFDYRNLEDLDSLMAAGGFIRHRLEGSSVIYDVATYRKAGSTPASA